MDRLLTLTVQPFTSASASVATFAADLLPNNTEILDELRKGLNHRHVWSLDGLCVGSPSDVTYNHVCFVNFLVNF